jgi:CubicO group peptidase (beta-lactamase class C family)
MKDGELLYSRGHGWCDAAGRKPVAPDALVRIASVTKSFTAAAVRGLIRDGKLTPDLKVFPYLGLAVPGGQAPDPRLDRVTVRHLLEHKGGWDEEKTFDPLFRTDAVRRNLRLPGEPSAVHVVQFMLTRPLQHDPGEKFAYSNFGYCVLGRVAEKASGKPYFDHLRQAVLAPLGIVDVRPARSSPHQRDPREVWYPARANQFNVEVMDANGGLVASAPAVCRFLHHYRLSGERRRPDDRAAGTFTGSLPATTAMARQRPDGVHVVVLMNGRRERTFAADNEQLVKLVDGALDAIFKKPAP